MKIDNLEIKKANNFIKRTIGLMFKKNINYGLIIDNCNSIHTFFMKENIDVILFDNDYKIIDIKKNIKPYKIILFKRKIKESNILEVPSNRLNNLKINDKLKIRIY